MTTLLKIMSAAFFPVLLPSGISVRMNFVAVLVYKLYRNMINAEGLKKYNIGHDVIGKYHTLGWKSDFCHASSHNSFSDYFNCVLFFTY